jgi:photosystem II stability/assembly factor-like uncharacterized protein
MPWAIVASGREPTLLCRDLGRWEQRNLPPGAVSLFPLIEGFCWLATASGIWRSVDGGKQWTSQWKGEAIQRLFFLDEQRGYAVGANKTILETADGGEHWEPLEAASAPRTTPEYTTYSWVEFGTRRAGIIVGWSRPPRSGITDVMPAWRDPARSSRRPEWPGASLTLETRDGGVTWKHSSISLFGRISRVRYTPDGRGLSLVEFHDAFEFPSEVFAIDLKTGRSERVYRDKQRAITDIALATSGMGMLAAVDVPPDPAKDDQGQVHLLASEDLRTWKEELLPEALRARRVWVGGFRPDSLWAATDTGVILARKA